MLWNAVLVPELQVHAHPPRIGNMFSAGETVFLSCVARGCAAPGRNFALYRNGINLGQSNKLSAIYNFDSQHAGTYTCRPIPPQNVQSPGVTLALGCEYCAYILDNSSVCVIEHSFVKTGINYILKYIERKLLFWSVIFTIWLFSCILIK